MKSLLSFILLSLEDNIRFLMNLATDIFTSCASFHIGFVYDTHWLMAPSTPIGTLTKANKDLLFIFRELGLVGISFANKESIQALSC